MTCPICKSSNARAETIPFDKSCETDSDSGDPVEYLTCVDCGYAWAPELCAKPASWFAEHIYNADYGKFDPEYDGTRAARQAQNIKFAYSFARARIRHLDFGSGEGLLTAKLKQAGFDSTSYDPFVHLEAPAGKFNLITCFEVFEHAPDPQRLFRHLASYLDDTGILIASTQLVSAGSLRHWWYASPRNGHISLFSAKSLCILATQHGLQARVNSEGTHSFFRQIPEWAQAGS